MQTVTHKLSGWTTDELLDEVVRRSATDGPRLQRLEAIVIRARLAESDRRFGGEVQSTSGSNPQSAGVRGTVEMGLADGESTVLPAAAAHEVEADTTGAHAHDHTHGRRSSGKLAAHLHHHVHLGDIGADGEFNGHTHAQAHAGHPWEDLDTA